MTVTLTADEVAKLKGSDPNKRYMVVYNGSDETIYPALIGYDTNNKILTDIDSVNLPSGFKLDPKTYKVLTFPKYVISGRIIARTGCTMVPGLYGNQDGLLCDTGDCHQSYDGTNTPSPNNTYASSQKGLLCNIIGGASPTTILEFSFTNAPGTDSRGQPMVANTDYYDVSQVDGNNLSAQMEPIINQTPTARGDPNYWCKKAGCTATLKTCPDELKVYRESDKKLIACQSIGSAMSGITTTIKPDRTPGVPGMYPGGHYNNNVGILKDVDPNSFKKLTDMYLTNYYWDQSATNKGGDSRPWTKTGAWTPDTDGSKCPLSCTGSGDSKQCSVPSTCITAQTLSSCAGAAGNKCGDPAAKPSVPPTFNSADQGCSPNVTTYNTPDYAPHLCWSENWPGQGPEYHKVFKDMCPNAYSWQFDDFSSTFTCDSSGPAPVHYFVQFYSYDGTPETLDLSTSKTSSFVLEDGAPFHSPHTSLFKKSIIAILVLFILILVLKLAL